MSGPARKRATTQAPNGSQARHNASAERLAVIEQIRAVVAADTDRNLDEMVADGWPVDDALHAIAAYWAGLVIAEVFGEVDR